MITNGVIKPLHHARFGPPQHLMIKRFIKELVISLTVVTATGTLPLSAQVVLHAPMPSDINTCLLCHTTPEFWTEGNQRCFVSADQLATDIHFQSGVRCVDCHGGIPFSFDRHESHAEEVPPNPWGLVPWRSPVNRVYESCRRCHPKEVEGLAESIHRQYEPSGPSGLRPPQDCKDCHGEIKHQLLPPDDPESPLFVMNQVKLCGHCHEESWNTYRESVHGHGLEESGLLVAAICSDCHGAHAILPADDPRSPLHSANVADTCAACHRFIRERLAKSVHGQGNGPGAESDRPAPGGQVTKHPSCTDCHEGHDLPAPESARFRLELPHRCGNCHVMPTERYSMSLHGALTDLGYVPAAKCSDCHGAHDILPIHDPNSRLAPGPNRLETCRQCHPYAVPNFCDFHPHADPHDAEQFPIQHLVLLFMELLIYSVFAFFGIHSIIWFFRSLIHVARHGRPARLVPGGPAIIRFALVHRLIHAVVIVSFLLLALTGLPLRYSSQEWAQWIARCLGGFAATSVLHHICGVITFGYFLVHVFWLAVQAFRARSAGRHWFQLIFSLDSPVPHWRDLRDLTRMIRWFVGLGPKPGFDRWTYWEKFDYWAVFWGVAIIGTSGLILWFPNLFCRVLPGEALNIAKIVHSEEALLATSFIFAIHFFGTHLRPEKFPMDLSILTGLVTEEELEDERPEHLERLRQSGKLDAMRTTVPSRSVVCTIRTGGMIALIVGIGLLIGMLTAFFGH